MFCSPRRLSKASVQQLINQYQEKTGKKSTESILKLQTLVDDSPGDSVDTREALKCFYPSEFDVLVDNPGSHARIYIVLAGLMRLAFGLDLPEKPQKLNTYGSKLDTALQSPAFMIDLLEEVPDIEFAMGESVPAEREMFLVQLHDFCEFGLKLNVFNKSSIMRAFYAFLGYLSKKKMLSPGNWKSFVDCFVTNPRIPKYCLVHTIFRSFEFLNLLTKDDDADLPKLDQALYDSIIRSDESVKRALQSLAALKRIGWKSNFRTFAEGPIIFSHYSQPENESFAYELTHIKEAWKPLMHELPCLLNERLSASGPQEGFAGVLEAWVFARLGRDPIACFQGPPEADLVFQPALPIVDVREILARYLRKFNRFRRPLEGEPLKLQELVIEAEKDGLTTIDTTLALNLFLSVDVSPQGASARAYFVLYNLLRLAKGLPIIKDTRAPIFQKDRHLDHYKPLLAWLVRGPVPLWTVEKSPENKETLANSILSVLLLFFEQCKISIAYESLLGVMSQRGLLNLENLRALGFFIEIHYDPDHFDELDKMGSYDRLCRILFEKDKESPLTQERFGALISPLTTEHSYPVFKRVFLSEKRAVYLDEEEGAWFRRSQEKSGMHQIVLSKLEQLMALYNTKRVDAGRTFVAEKTKPLTNLCRLGKLRQEGAELSLSVGSLEALKALTDWGLKIDCARYYIIVEGIIAEVFGYFDLHVKEMVETKFKKPGKRSEIDDLVLRMVSCLLRDSPRLGLVCPGSPEHRRSFKNHLMGFLYIYAKGQNSIFRELDLGCFRRVLEKLSAKNLLTLENIRSLHQSGATVDQIKRLNDRLREQGLTQEVFEALLREIGPDCSVAVVFGGANGPEAFDSMPTQHNEL